MYLPVQPSNPEIAMSSNGTSPLTPLAQDALDALATALPDAGELTYEQAYAILNDEEVIEPLLPRISSNGLHVRPYLRGRREAPTD